MKEPHLCMSGAADLKMKLLDLHIIGNNAICWRVEEDVIIATNEIF